MQLPKRARMLVDTVMFEQTGVGRGVCTAAHRVHGAEVAHGGQDEGLGAGVRPQVVADQLVVPCANQEWVQGMLRRADCGMLQCIKPLSGLLNPLLNMSVAGHLSISFPSKMVSCGWDHGLRSGLGSLARVQGQEHLLDELP